MRSSVTNHFKYADTVHTDYTAAATAARHGTLAAHAAAREAVIVTLAFTPHRLLFGSAGDADQVDTVAISRAVGKIVAEVRALLADALAVWEDAHMLPVHLQAAHEVAPAIVCNTVLREKDVRPDQERRRCGRFAHWAAARTSSSRKEGQPCWRDSLTKLSQLRPMGAWKSWCPVFES